jgi:hypothetical protein
MVGRFQDDPSNPKDNRFEVGIVQGAFFHNFKLQMRNSDGKLEDLTSQCGANSTCSFEVVDSSGNSVPPIQKYMESRLNASDFDRLKKPDDKIDHDFRYLIDIEGKGFHGNKLDNLDNLDNFRIPHAFSRIFQVHNGTAYSNCITFPLQTTKGQYTPTAPSPYGYTAEIASVKITLKQGQQLVLKVNNKTIPICSFGAGKPVEARVLNLPCKNINNHKCMDSDPSSDHGYIKENCKDIYIECPANPPNEPSHFQYFYYRVFDIPPSERYEISCCPSCIKEKDKFVRKGIFPLRCGMVILGQSKKSLEL